MISVSARWWGLKSISRRLVGNPINLANLKSEGVIDQMLSCSVERGGLGGFLVPAEAAAEMAARALFWLLWECAPPVGSPGGRFLLVGPSAGWRGVECGYPPAAVVQPQCHHGINNGGNSGSGANSSSGDLVGKPMAVNRSATGRPLEGTYRPSAAGI
jgi:hypothetical protein